MKVVYIGVSVDLIRELEKHQKSRGHNFGELNNYEIWCDNVQPLLHFSEKHVQTFERAKVAALVTYRIGSREDALNNMNETIGIVNQAIILGKSMAQEREFETNSKQEDILKFPEKVTLVWLAKHVEVKHWFTLLTLLFAVFLAGVKVGSSDVYLKNIGSIQPLTEKIKSNKNDF